MIERTPYPDSWGIALIVIVLFSWAFYRRLAPKTWREWGSAGAVQAFIIALYAEMYGFPLTIYLLVRFSGIDDGELSANLWSTLLGIGELSMLVSMLVGYCLVLIGVGLIIQGWRELHRAHRKHRLAKDGLYSLVRHPQYTGLFIILFGEGVVHWPTFFSISLFPIIVLAYSLLACHEERKMTARYGGEYKVYLQGLPRFIPKIGKLLQFTKSSFSGLIRVKRS